jgi:RNA polymerase sigma-70 factor (ECF subfamily)
VGVGKADDVVVETFLAAFQYRTSYDVARPDARPWLFGILTRKLARHQRTERADYRALARAPIGAGEDSPEDEVAARVSARTARAALAAALAALSDRDRDVLLLIALGRAALRGSGRRPAHSRRDRPVPAQPCPAQGAPGTRWSQPHGWR